MLLQLYRWAKNVGENFLAQNAGMGDDGDEIEEFVTKHETLKLETEVCPQFKSGSFSTTGILLYARVRS